MKLDSRLIQKKLKRKDKAGIKSLSIQKIEDLTPLNGYKPTKNKKQMLAHALKVLFILFGGAVGGGKTAWLVCSAILHCLMYPGARVFLCRQHLSSFKRTTLLELEKFLPLGYVKKHHRTENFILFRNGSRIYYGGLGDDVRAIDKLKSMELSAWGCDQVEEISEQFFHMLNSRLRLATVPQKEYKGWLTCNPTSNWVRQRFIESSLENHAFVQSLPKENPFLPSDYEQRLRETLPDELVQAWVDGNWDVIADENQVFSYQEIEDAMNRKASKEGEPYYSCDVSRYGNDETVIAKLEGQTVTIEKVFSKKSTMETSGKLIKETGFDLSAPIKIDSIGVGGGVYDRLQEQHYNVQEYISSSSAKENKIYKNKRAEDFFHLKKLLSELSIPNDPKLKSQMMSIRYRIFSDGLILIESKDEIRKRGLPSPDRLDAIVMVCSGDKYLTKKELEEKLQTMKPVKGEHKWPSLRAKSKRAELEEEMRVFLGGNIRVKKSKSQMFDLEDLGIESDIKPTQKDSESD